jgi:hypothetical protein
LRLKSLQLLSWSEHYGNFSIVQQSQSLLWKCYSNFSIIKLNLHSTYDLIPVDHEVFFYALLGVISAGGALMFNHVLIKFINLRTKIKQPFISFRWKYCLTVGFFIAAICHPAVFMRLSEKYLEIKCFTLVNLENSIIKR